MGDELRLAYLRSRLAVITKFLALNNKNEAKSYHRRMWLGPFMRGYTPTGVFEMSFKMPLVFKVALAIIAGAAVAAAVSNAMMLLH